MRRYCLALIGMHQHSLLQAFMSGEMDPYLLMQLTYEDVHDAYFDDLYAIFSPPAYEESCYEQGQFYHPHHDYFADEFSIQRGGQRVATFLMYLTEGMQGGETFFPWVGDNTCSCGGEEKRGTCIEPRQGDALLFWSQKLDGTVDSATSHGSCTVLEGEKWSATKWLRQKEFS
ncbi:hypothetical protein L7F22_004052 [Adiantum nelumboides]|nr:hypothetical protein [Adiantum nelumboides]